MLVCPFLPKIMYFVLATLSVNLLAANHSFMIDNSSRRVNIKSTCESLDVYKAVSSALRLTDEFVQCSLMSLIYKINKSGPRMEPWGTPVVTVNFSDSWPWYLTD